MTRGVWLLCCCRRHQTRPVSKRRTSAQTNYSKTNHQIQIAVCATTAYILPLFLLFISVFLLFLLPPCVNSCFINSCFLPCVDSCIISCVLYHQLYQSVVSTAVSSSTSSPSPRHHSFSSPIICTPCFPMYP